MTSFTLKVFSSLTLFSSVPWIAETPYEVSWPIIGPFWFSCPFKRLDPLGPVHVRSLPMFMPQDILGQSFSARFIPTGFAVFFICCAAFLSYTEVSPDQPKLFLLSIFSHLHQFVLLRVHELTALAPLPFEFVSRLHAWLLLLWRLTAYLLPH